MKDMKWMIQGTQCSICDNNFSYSVVILEVVPKDWVVCSIEIGTTNFHNG